MEATLEAPYTNVLLLLREVDLMKKWVPMIMDVKIMNEYTTWRQLMYQRFDSPWPMKDREDIVEVTCYMVPGEDALVFSFESASTPEWFGTKITRDKKNAVEMLFNKSFGYIKPLGPNKTHFKFIINADP